MGSVLFVGERGALDIALQIFFARFDFPGVYFSGLYADSFLHGALFHCLAAADMEADRARQLKLKLPC